MSLKEATSVRLRCVFLFLEFCFPSLHKYNIYSRLKEATISIFYARAYRFFSFIFFFLFFLLREAMLTGNMIVRFCCCYLFLFCFVLTLSLQSVWSRIRILRLCRRDLHCLVNHTDTVPLRCEQTYFHQCITLTQKAL